MKLDYSYQDLAHILGAELMGSSNGEIHSVNFDSRRIFSAENSLFLALNSNTNNGHDFIEDAYSKGIRSFLVSQECIKYKDATYFIVEDVLESIQKLAKYHRNRFSIPTIAITGSYGKTMVKEWLYAVLKSDFHIVRSPKSYNSQLGVALSVLELKEQHSLAIFEAGISQKGEMEALEDMIQPTLGIFTGLGKPHSDNFESTEIHLKEKLSLFRNCNFTFANKEFHSPLRRMKINAELTTIEEWADILPDKFTFKKNLVLCYKVAEFLGIEKSELKRISSSLTELVGRLETAEGINNNLIINDTYNIDIDALEQALAFQFSSNEKRLKAVVVDIELLSEVKKQEIRACVNQFNPEYYFEVSNSEFPSEIFNISNTSILFKGQHGSFLSKEIGRFVEKKHQTWIEYNLSNVRHNIAQIRSRLPNNTTILGMVKASSYGSGDLKLAHFLQNNGVEYLGVAYADEGVALRNSGIHLPILVLNAQQEAFEDIVEHNLQPAIFSFDQLDDFIKTLIAADKWQYPVHIKFDTGMHRLGFEPDEAEAVLEAVQGQPEIKIQGVYSHLANSDLSNDQFTFDQLSIFETIKKRFIDEYEHKISFHLLNSNGVKNYAEKSHDMVRIGIGMFGVEPGEDSVVSWFTRISQIKTIENGDFVGYGKSFQAEKEMQIAILPIGYADGLQRCFAQNGGGVYLNNQFCKIVGNICMDMVMIDVTSMECSVGDTIELLGVNQSLQELASKMGTIPYEVLTNMGSRVKRVYTEE